MAQHVVVVGAGQAGSSLVAKLRALGHEGRITLIGEEPQPPYQRPPLSKKYLLGEMDLERLYLRPESFYAEQQIETRWGTRATAIDPAARQLHLGDVQLDYDVLALTLGAGVRRLPAAIGGDLQGVFEVRNIADVDRMAPEVIDGKRALVIGGGYIGLEAAAVLAARGVQTTVIEQGPRILGRVAAAETSEFFRDLHRTRGVTIREEMGLARLIGENGRVTGAELSDGSQIAIDFAVVGIGIAPETALAETAGLTLENGIAVDEHCRTSDPAIYAAGDCASFPWQGGRLRLESVQNAIDQAEHAAEAIMGSDAAYVPEPWFWSDQYDCKLQIAGLNTGFTRTVVRPGTRPGGQSVWYFRNNDLIAVDAMNDPKAYMQGKRWIAAGISPTPELLADGSQDLRKLI
ncbi:MAG: FAD/NAD(P)-binding oxidoreductase [Pseudomonadota bacterium]